IFTRLGETREGGNLVAGAAERVDPVDDRGQLAIFFRRFCEIGARKTRAGQRIAQLRVATEELIQMLLERCSHNALSSRTPADGLATRSTMDPSAPRSVRRYRDHAGRLRGAQFP